MYTPHGYSPAEALAAAGAAMLHSNAPKQAPVFLARHPLSAASPLCRVCLALRAASASTETQTASPAVLLAADITDCCKHGCVPAAPSTAKEGAGVGQELLLDLVLLLRLAPTCHPCWEGAAVAAKALDARSPFLQNLLGSWPCAAAGGAACAHQHALSARSCPHCLLPFGILAFCGFSVLGQSEAGRADLSTILGEACAEPNISSPCRKNPRVSRKNVQMELPNWFRNTNDAHKTIPYS